MILTLVFELDVLGIQQRRELIAFVTWKSERLVANAPVCVDVT